MQRRDSDKDIGERRKHIETYVSQSDNQETGRALQNKNDPPISFDTLDSLLMEYLEKNKKVDQSQMAANSIYPDSGSQIAIKGDQKIDEKVNTCFPEALNLEEKTKNSGDLGHNLAENMCRSETLQLTTPKPYWDSLSFSMTFLNKAPEDQTREQESELEKKKVPNIKKRSRNSDSQDLDGSISKKIALSNTQEDKDIFKKESDKVTCKRLPQFWGPDHMELNFEFADLNMEPTFHSQELTRNQKIQKLGQRKYKNIEKPTRDKGVQQTCPSKTYGRIQYEAQKSSLLKDEEKGRELQSTSHTPNTFDVLDTFLAKLNEEKDEPSHSQGIGFDGRIQYEAQKSSLLKDEEEGRALQSTSHIPNTFDVLDALLAKLNEEKD